MPGVAAEQTSIYDRKFNLLFARGREAVLAGTHHRDGPPVDGGRWGISVVLRPDPAVAAQLDAVAGEALALAGAHHWPTGSAATSHVTVLPLEPYRQAVPDDDPEVARYAAGLAKAASASRRVNLRFGGLTLSPVGVMACAYPTDDAADGLATHLRTTLGDNRWSERDIWYATLVHFTDAVADPQALVDWVAARRRLDLGRAGIGEVELVGWDVRGRQPAMVSLAAEPLS